MKTKFFFILLLSLLFSSVAFAEKYEDGLAAMDKKAYKKAILLFEFDAKRGNPKSQYKLGTIYYDGQGVKKDFKKRLIGMNLLPSRGTRTPNIIWA